MRHPAAGAGPELAASLRFTGPVSFLCRMHVLLNCNYVNMWFNLPLLYVHNVNKLKMHFSASDRKVIVKGTVQYLGLIPMWGVL